MARWLWRVADMYGDEDEDKNAVSEAFLEVCKYDYFKAAQWLWSLGILDLSVAEKAIAYMVRMKYVRSRILHWLRGMKA
jgi:hypothetical protein